MTIFTSDIVSPGPELLGSCIHNTSFETLHLYLSPVPTGYRCPCGLNSEMTQRRDTGNRFVCSYSVRFGAGDMVSVLVSFTMCVIYMDSPKGRRPLVECALHLTMMSMGCPPNAVQRRMPDDSHSSDYSTAIGHQIMR